MRVVRIVLALVFGLAMAGPETHACPVHSAAPAAPAHHQDGKTHQEGAHCTCPQTCCPAGVSVSLPASSPSWTTTPLPMLVVDVDPARSLILPQRKHLLPFALAPPQPLA